MNHKENPLIGVGATQELCLRVSVATIARVLFKDPVNGRNHLVLERKASLQQTAGRSIFEVISQPFGGAVWINDVNKIFNLLDDYHFDTEHSKSQNDFRLFIRPTDWPRLRDFVIEHLSSRDDHDIEIDPERELAEEFKDALKTPLVKTQYRITPECIVLEGQPTFTKNHRTEVYPSVRVYRIFEVEITDYSLGELLKENSETITNQDLIKLAEKDFREGGKGRANAVFMVSLARILAFYHSLPVDNRKSLVLYKNVRLSGNVSALFDDLYTPVYQRIFI